MKLVVTIPAYNEEKTIAEVIHSIPRKIPGITSVEVLVMNDGSDDDTVKIAEKAGADHIITHKKKQGLARSFIDALNSAVEKGADIIVNTDADNQYDQNEIEKLIKPILNGEADMVVGDRQVEKLDWMVKSKKYGNILGSRFVRKISGQEVTDASSGFRAMLPICAKKFILHSAHTYTHETIIQAGKKGLTVVNVPITFKKRAVGESKLISNVPTHIKKSGLAIVRSILMYDAFKVLTQFGGFFVLVGLIIGVRFVYYFSIGLGNGHIQSLILSAILIILGVNTIFLGVIADLIAYNRKILEEIYEKK